MWKAPIKETDEDDRHYWQQRIHAIPILLNWEFCEEEEISRLCA
jgi:hypothetical protein